MSDSYIASSSLYERSRRAINELHEGELILDDKPYYYVYKILGSSLNIISLIATMPLKHYKNGLVLPHEMTIKSKELEYMRSLSEFKIQISPVLLIHRYVSEIYDLLETLAVNQKHCNYYVDAQSGLEHYLWQVVDIEIISKITNMYQRIDKFYLVDGHHRISAITSLLNGDKRIMSMLTAGESLNMGSIGRGLRLLPYTNNESFFEKLNTYFHIHSVPHIDNTQKLQHHECLMRIKRQWYRMVLREELLNGLDYEESVLHSLLHTYLFNKVFKITNHNDYDSNIVSIPYRDIKSLESLVDHGELKLVFCTSLLIIDELLVLANRGKLFPPQSTYFEPKPIDGLIMNVL